MNITPNTKQIHLLRGVLVKFVFTELAVHKVKPVPTWLRKLLTFGKGRAKGSFPNLPITNNARKNV